MDMNEVGVQMCGQTLATSLQVAVLANSFMQDNQTDYIIFISSITLIIAVHCLVNVISGICVYKFMVFPQENRQGQTLCLVMHLLQIGLLWRVMKLILTREKDDSRELTKLLTSQLTVQGFVYIIGQAMAWREHQSYAFHTLPVAALAVTMTTCAISYTFLETNWRQVTSLQPETDLLVNDGSTSVKKFLCFLLVFLTNMFMLCSRYLALFVLTSLIGFWVLVVLLCHAAATAVIVYIIRSLYKDIVGTSIIDILKNLLHVAHFVKLYNHVTVPEMVLGLFILGIENVTFVTVWFLKTPLNHKQLFIVLIVALVFLGTLFILLETAYKFSHYNFSSVADRLKNIAPAGVKVKHQNKPDPVINPEEGHRVRGKRNQISITTHNVRGNDSPRKGIKINQHKRGDAPLDGNKNIKVCDKLPHIIKQPVDSIFHHENSCSSGTKADPPQLPGDSGFCGASFRTDSGHESVSFRNRDSLHDSSGSHVVHVHQTSDVTSTSAEFIELDFDPVYFVHTSIMTGSCSSLEAMLDSYHLVSTPHKFTTQHTDRTRPYYQRKYKTNSKHFINTTGQRFSTSCHLKRCSSLPSSTTMSSYYNRRLVAKRRDRRHLKFRRNYAFSDSECSSISNTTDSMSFSTEDTLDQLGSDSELDFTMSWPPARRITSETLKDLPKDHIKPLDNVVRWLDKISFSDYIIDPSESRLVLNSSNDTATNTKGSNLQARTAPAGRFQNSAFLKKSIYNYQRFGSPVHWSKTINSGNVFMKLCCANQPKKLYPFTVTGEHL